ncbi:hypothetical protein [Spirosoma panaciterrae]|uniref:hypothetical protein n=1 Tax=Spirosoma panaciterrae TaxID=496058 RepID=UPI0012F83948|nr:hypothetical protein [Spirosoma panaciterrae]
MAYIGIVIPLMVRSSKAYFFYRILFWLLVIYILLCVFSQIAVFVYQSDFPPSKGLILISYESSFFLRSSLFTQSLYIIPSFSLLSYIMIYFRPKYQKHLEYALWIFVGFGFYDTFFYILFKKNGDFLSNRIFGDGILNPGQFQLFNLLGIELKRFVSLTGEPSMYVFAIFPFFVYFLYQKKIKLSIFLGISLLLTFSGTFILAMFLLALLHFIIVERNLKQAIIILILCGSFIAIIPGDFLNLFLKDLLFDKINQESLSGIERTQNFVDQIAFYQRLPLINKFFGVGFGTVRSTDLFSTLLVNTGIVGFLSFSALFSFPLFRLPKSDNGLRIALIITYLILQISVSEYSYPALWLLLGLAYNKVDFKLKSEL